MSKKVLTPLGVDFEETECVTVVDLLRRAGCEVTLAAVDSLRVPGAHGIVIEADKLLSACDPDSYDALFLPGGSGVAALRDRPEIRNIITHFSSRGKCITAICAAPLLLSDAGLLAGKKATSFPGVAEQIQCEQYLEQEVVVDGTIITSRGVGTAGSCGCALIEALLG